MAARNPGLVLEHIGTVLGRSFHVAAAFSSFRADLALWRKQLRNSPPPDRAKILSVLKHWQQDPDLNGIRDASALPVDEQQAFTQLWADVAELLNKAEEK